MQKWTKRVLVMLLVIVPAVVMALIFLAAPKSETPRDEAFPEGDLTLIAQGDIEDGGPRHPAEGNVSLYWNGTGYLLRFEGYDARSGPNVWFYVASAQDPDSEEAIEDDGLLVRVPGPGHATYRGQFNVPLPPEFHPDTHQTLVAWDRTFNTRYALATLEPVPSQTDGTDGNQTEDGGASSQHP